MNHKNKQIYSNREGANGSHRIDDHLRVSTIKTAHSYYRTSIWSYMIIVEWWHFQWSSRTLNPVFKVTAFLKLNISAADICPLSYGQSCYRTLIGNRTKHMEWYHVWWPWLTFKRVARFVGDSWLSCLLSLWRQDVTLCVWPGAYVVGPSRTDLTAGWPRGTPAHWAAADVTQYAECVTAAPRLYARQGES